MKAIVVGAGLAGLTAGHYLQKAGWLVQVLESAPQVGGRAATVIKGGYCFDSGAVGIGTVYKDYMALLRDLGIENQVVQSSSINATLRGGLLHEMDSSAALRSGLRLGSLSLRSKLVLPKLFWDLSRIRPPIDIANASASATHDNETAAQYARRRLNEEILAYLIDPLIRTLNLSRPDRVSKLELMNALSGLFDTQMISLRGGVATMPNTLAKSLPVCLSSAVDEVICHADRVDVHYGDKQGAQRETADACVIATTLPQAIHLYPPARHETAPLSASIRYNRGLCVHLGYRRATKTRALMIMVPTLENPEIAVVFLEHNKAPDRAPAGHSMITVFYDDVAVNGPWRQCDEELVAAVRTFIERILPELAGHIEMSHVTRWSEGLPHPGVGYFRQIQAMKLRRDPSSRVQLAGDYLSSAGQNTAVAYGRVAAENLIKAFH